MVWRHLLMLSNPTDHRVFSYFRSGALHYLGGDVPQTMLTIFAASNILQRNFMHRNFMHKAAAYLNLCNFNVVHAHLDVANRGGHVGMIQILKVFQLLDNCPVYMTLKHSNLGLSRAELVSAYENMLQDALTKRKHMHTT
ncbi:hypothetical protein Plhal710r2_c033g0122351 [Plasmopara halstedii]